MTERAQPLRLDDLRRDPRLYDVLVDHALRGVQVQMLLRAAVAIFVIVTIIAVPPTLHAAGCYVVAGLYAIWVVVLGRLSLRGGERAVRLIWLALFIDVLALGALSVLSGHRQQSWTSDVLVNAFFVIPMLAGA